MSGALVIGKQNRLMEAFEDGGALEPGVARSLDELGVRESFLFRRMVSQGVFHSVDGDRWWMDQEAAAAFVHRRHRLILIFMLVAVALLFTLAEW